MQDAGVGPNLQTAALEKTGQLADLQSGESAKTRLIDRSGQRLETLLLARLGAGGRDQSQSGVFGEEDLRKFDPILDWPFFG